MKRTYITTAIPYVNADPHIGFALELVQTDAYARWRRQQGDAVRFLTGTDENALKNVQAAESRGVDIQSFVDKLSQRFRELAVVLGASPDDFIRTREERHIQGAQKLWRSCKPDDIYRKKYTGLYCVGCEVFYRQEELDEEGNCPEHKRPPERVEEENYFFRLSHYQEEIHRLIATGELEIIPDTRRNEVLRFIEQGLEDFSVSRSNARARGWGVPVPDDPSQVMYVWFDALSNYINAVDYAHESDLYDQWWRNAEVVHVIGKGIIRFHAVYWIAMLLSAGVPLPKKIFVHGYIHVKGEKMSKSLGNVVDPFDLAEAYGADAVRYFLLRHIPAWSDGDFTFDQFHAAYTSALVNDLGNLVQRVFAMIERYAEGTVQLTNPPHRLDRVDAWMEQFQFDKALEEIWGEVSWANRFIEEKKPWELAKDSSPDAQEDLREVLGTLAASIREIGDRLVPFLPQTADAIQTLFLQEAWSPPSSPLFPRRDPIHK